ncbi:Terminal organelle assembly protein [Trema orientale]|uniref:Terminal organelle assembly protein n=1 Tax=Trema orientale TaxID=63057 RepID=A0A2P5BJD6_TREOI|nr:Terminal organelle assembly protein [Trema orientale]
MAMSDCYYTVLGICKEATAPEIREAYRRLALKWHPDRWMKDPKVAGEAKRRFQRIQEAYSVLSDKGKRTVYDAGLLGFLGDDDDEGFCDFMQEMVFLMQSENKRSQEKNSLEDLQGLLRDMINEDKRVKFGFDWDNPPSSRKKIRTCS